MTTTDERRERLREIDRRGIPVPNTAYADAERAFPSAQTRAWSWWANVWDRPSARTADGPESSLASVQEQWDASDAFVRRQDQLKADLDRKVADAERQAAAAAEARRVKLAEQEKASIRSAYLRANPSATDAEFAAAFPRLLERHRERRMDEATAKARAAMRSML